MRLAIHAEKEAQAKAQWLPDLGVPNHFGKHPFSGEGISAVLAGDGAADNLMSMNEGSLKLHHLDAPEDLDPDLDRVLKWAYEKLEHDKSPAPDIVRMMCRGKRTSGALCLSPLLNQLVAIFSCMASCSHWASLPGWWFLRCSLDQHVLRTG